jgi:ribonuclease T
VLSRAAQAAGLPWDNSEAHSALYDASQTAKLFCTIINRWAETSGPVWSDDNGYDEQR